MKPAAFAYHAPRTAAAAVHLLAQLGDAAKVLAGGQSPRGRRGIAAPEFLRHWWDDPPEGVVHNTDGQRREAVALHWREMPDVDR